MSSAIYNLMDTAEAEFPSAAEWEAGIAWSGNGVAHAVTNTGIGFFLYDDKGKPLAACSMTPEQAMAQALYMLRVAARMLAVTKPDERPEHSLQHEAIRIAAERCGLKFDDGNGEAATQR